MKNIIKIKGPILIFGAGGFIGINLLIALTKKRDDVYGVFQNPGKSWRLKKSGISTKYVIKGNLTNASEIKTIIKKIRPQTIFNLAAYGAYSKQDTIEKIYKINLISTVNLIEILKKNGFSIYIHAGSQSEYGLNASHPSEISELIPNSHYAVSKTADYYLMKYYGKVEKIPVIHTRLYSVYGPYEEPDRLIPTIIRHAKKRTLPPFVAANISRDFIFIDDVIDALLVLATNVNKKHYGEAFNIATGKKTTVRLLVSQVKRLFDISSIPEFGKMTNRKWDVVDWVGNPDKMYKSFGFKPKFSLEEGLKKTYDYF